MSSYPHQSVLFDEILQAFHQTKIRTFADGTLGAGGHAEGILTHHPEIERFFGIDQDPSALEIARQRLAPWQNKLIFTQANFIQLPQILLTQNAKEGLDGIMLDLGVSSMQLDQAEKGFSFMRDGPLDMRMDPTNPLTAADIVNGWSEQELGRVFREYGEEKQWRKAAQVIIEARKTAPILTTHALVAILRPAFSWKQKGVNPLTLIFQGLRICVNRELEVLEAVLPAAIKALAPGGILAVISFHSLEDRIVKNIFRHAADDKENTEGLCGLFLDKDPTVELITRKPILPTENEIKQNPRSRSAKLRIIKKL